jgi:hypothetical protein
MTSRLEKGIHDTMYTESLCDYIRKKHALCHAKLESVHTVGLQSSMRWLHPIKRVTTAKVIHRWIPTNDHLHKQGSADSPLCPRGCGQCETADHILKCGDKEAQLSRQNALYKALSKLVANKLSIDILCSLEESLTQTMQISSLHKYNPIHKPCATTQHSLKDARISQNLI